ncbi:hypothetical protein F5887DRAFT_1012150 [Amanita rubescens]|nr:hypothetical protein F5887DRAFT_1012150 [Amanita rubescens]
MVAVPEHSSKHLLRAPLITLLDPLLLVAAAKYRFGFPTCLSRSMHLCPSRFIANVSRFKLKLTRARHHKMGRLSRAASSKYPSPTSTHCSLIWPAPTTLNAIISRLHYRGTLIRHYPARQGMRPIKHLSMLHRIMEENRVRKCRVRLCFSRICNLVGKVESGAEVRNCRRT